MADQENLGADPPTLPFRVCDVCGQRFDTSDLDQVFHHDAAPHQPLLSDHRAETRNG